MPRIDIIIDATGDSVTVQTAGYKGSECKAITKAIEVALGAKVSDTPTKEMYSNVVTDNQIQNRS